MLFSLFLLVILSEKSPRDRISAEILGDDAILSQDIVFCSRVILTLIPDADQVAKNLKVSNFYCGAKKTFSMLSTRYYNATFYLKNCKPARRESLSNISLSGNNLMQQNVAYSISEKNGTVDITTTAAITTLLQDFPKT